MSLVTTWRRSGYVIRSYQNDHAPLHVHVFHEGKELARFDLKNHRWMDAISRNHAGRARRAIIAALGLGKKE